MKKTFLICESCRIIGFEKGEILFVTKKNSCNSCGYSISDGETLESVQIHVVERDKSEKVETFAVISVVEPSTKMLRLALRKRLEETS